MSTQTIKVLGKSEVETVLEAVIRDENLLGAEVEVGAGSSKGQGFLSYMTRADIKAKNKCLSVILKKAPSNEEFRKLMPIRELFLREIHFYEEILPVFQKFQQEKNVENPLLSFTKIYKTDKTEFDELLVMENLRTQGFDLSEKTQPLDENHFELVLAGYAKLHAISFALKDQNPELFAELTQNLDLVMGPKHYSEEFFNTIGLFLDKVIALFKEEEEIRENLKKLKNNFMDIFQFVQENVAKYAVISHGDCWANNFMFQYKDTENPKKPTDFKFLDFQVQHLGSPVMDLSYFIFSSSRKNRLDQLDTHLDSYYTTLSSHIKSLGSDPDKVFPKHILQQDWPIYCRYGYLISLLITTALFSDADEMYDITDVVNTDVKFEETINIKYKYQDLMDEMIVGLTRHMHQRGHLKY